MLRALKFTFLILTILFVVAFAVQIYLYFNPIYENYGNYLPDSRYIQEAAQSVISAEKGGHIYSAFWCIVWLGISFCGFWYFKGKLSETDDIKKKQSPDTMNALVEFSKRHKALLADIDACGDSQDRLRALSEKVAQYNADADAFAQNNGVSPKLITYTDYDAKLIQN